MNRVFLRWVLPNEIILANDSRPITIATVVFRMRHKHLLQVYSKTNTASPGAPLLPINDYLQYSLTLTCTVHVFCTEYFIIVLSSQMQTKLVTFTSERVLYIILI